MAQAIWRVTDWLDDRCAKEQIGKPKPDEDAVTEALGEEAEALKYTPSALRKDVLKAYQELGGVKFLVKNPGLLQKLLLKMVSEQSAPTTAGVSVNISWLSPDRLAYQRDNVTDIAPALAGNQMIEDAVEIPDHLPPQAWMPGPGPDMQAHRTWEELKKVTTPDGVPRALVDKLWDKR